MNSGAELRLRVGTGNLTNKYPFVADGVSANTDAETYRLLGRTYFADLRF